MLDRQQGPFIIGRGIFDAVVTIGLFMYELRQIDVCRQLRNHAAAFLRAKLRHQDIGGHIAAATFRLVWHGEVHTRTGLAVLIAGAVIYAVGSVLLAGPTFRGP